MTTKRDLIAAALGELGMATYIFDATPEELQDALARMNRLAAQWDGNSIRTGYAFGSDINAESGLPDTLEDAFVTNVAVRVAPTFGKVVSVETRVAARTAYNAMLTTLAKRPEMPYPGRMPMGTGNKMPVDPLSPQYFGPNGDTVQGVNEGATEY